jgi:ATP-dependent DNA ligase
VFDALSLGGADLRDLPFAERRQRLERSFGRIAPPLHLTPLTDDAALAIEWFDRARGGGIDGVVAKHRELRYGPGRRSMVKVKRERTADCVVAGFRLLAERPLPSSLLLGLFDGNVLVHVGVAAGLSERLRSELLTRLKGCIVSLAGHPWEHGFLLSGGAAGRLPGAAGRWAPGEMTLDWVPVTPALVCEAAYDHVDGRRFRHPARFRRWRPDRDAASCRIEQLDEPGTASALGASDLLAGP